ncbi:MAG: PIN domain-containing protein [Acidobacteria bacterium]|nr:MAG: PIN domain-containing protein [Acidobacteriota bacterium]REK09646.1 MAG: PIN domain-containing protein [Acidobacteriota bacterium]
MIALDTNVLVRLLVEDDEAQTARCKALVERIQAEGATAWVSDVVICEFVWVLSTSYKLGRGDVSDLVDALLRARHLVYRDSARLRRALDRFRAGKGNFADYLVREDAVEAGCSQLATFDGALLNEAEFFIEP